MKRTVGTGIFFIAVSFLLTACVANSSTNERSSAHENEVYRRRNIELPDSSFIVSRAAANDDYVYVYGYPLMPAEDYEATVYRYTTAGEYVDQFSNLGNKTDSDNVFSMFVAKNNILWLAWNRSCEYQTNDDNKRNYLIEAYDLNGNHVTAFEIDDNDVFTCMIADEDRVYLASSNKLAVYDHKGVLQFAQENINDVRALFFDCHGIPCVSHRSLAAQVISSLDTSRGDLLQMRELPEAAGRSFSGRSYDFYTVCDGVLYGMSETEEAPISILELVNLSFAKNCKDIIEIGERQFIIYNSQRISIVYPVPASEEMITITLGTLDSKFVSDMVDSFNSQQDKCEIKIVDYSQYNLIPAGKEGLMKLNTEIISGGGPDILDLSSLPFSYYQKAGILEDLYPYIRADAEINRMEFIPEILKSMEYNGKLYSMIPSYSILTILSSNEYVKADNALRFESLLDMSRIMEEGKNPFGLSVSKKTFFDLIFSSTSPAFVDYDKPECNFESEEFRQLLEFAETLPDEADRSNDLALISSGEQYLVPKYISSYGGLIAFDYYFGGDLILAGIPNAKQTGALLCPYISLGISVNSQNKELAWTFISSYLSEDYQKKISELLLTPTKVGMEHSEKLFRKWLSGDGKFIVMDAYGNDTVVDIEEDMPFVLMDRLLSSVVSIYSDDGALRQIIWNDSEKYFLGEVSLDETLTRIQSKANIYLSEQYG